MKYGVKMLLSLLLSKWARLIIEHIHKHSEWIFQTIPMWYVQNAWRKVHFEEEALDSEVDCEKMCFWQDDSTDKCQQTL